MKKAYLLLFFICSFSYGQYEKEIDSLTKIISSKKDNLEKSKAYDVLIQLYLDIDLKIAKKHIQSLYDLNKNSNCIECEIIADLNNGYYHDMLAENEKSIQYFERCSQNCLKINDYQNYELAQMQIAQDYIALHNHEKAELVLNNVINFSKKHNLKDNLYFLYYLKGTLNADRSYYKLGLENYILAEKTLLKTKPEDLRTQIDIINMIGVIYSNIENHNKAREYNNKAIKIAEKLNDMSIKMNVIRNRGFIESTAKNYTAALPYLLEAYEYHSETNNINLKGMGAYFLGRCYYELKNYTKSLEYSNEAIKIYENSQNNIDYARALNNRARIDLKFNKLDEAKEDIELSKSLMKNKQSRNYIEILTTEIDYLVKSNNLKEAITSINSRDSLNTILKNKTDLTNLNELQTIYETEKKEQQIKLLSTQNELAEKQKYIYIGLLGLLVILGTSLFYGYRNKIKTAQKLNELNELKSRFFANISHEFRTPLTLIKSPVQSLQAEISNESQKSKLDLIDKNSNRMLDLVDQLLELSKLDSGKLQLILKEGNIGLFLNSIVESFSFQAKENKLSFTSTIEKNSENHHFDKDVIEKIVTNLLSNAIKYTSENEKVSFQSKIENNQLQLVVSNSGSKIKKEEINKLFERFYQKKENHQGVGIGLALVKELVELYKGKIETNVENGILSFTVLLPLEKSNQNAIVVTKETTHSLNDQNTNESELPILLLVDDNQDVRTILKDIFKENYQIIEAADGEQALKIAKKEIPDCIISDVMMPKMDGFEFTKQIKTNELTSFIPVILLTAKTSDEAHLEGLKSTADAFLTKPFNNEIVKATVLQLIEERKKLHIRYSQELVLRPVDIVINSVEEKFIEKLQLILNKELANSEFSSDDFAASIGMSRMQLHRKLKSLLGVSTSEFLRNERLKASTELLKKGKANISEIAYSVGFNDVSYFSKCFKEMYHCTPTEYMEK
ncbi:response regulator [Flavobacterium azooxidireducens]|uniref:histidine kinase n=1 Tax=Flavobacterium azooxidireducens TaxID=1871076 RepID=A0ABY4KF73_9FLAO|nr:response regulator [Flavobacterium azooxidireducens]UPQ79460.1 response regulator [Flavobacterium azooxidireducens]